MSKSVAVLGGEAMFNHLGTAELTRRPFASNPRCLLKKFPSFFYDLVFPDPFVISRRFQDDNFPVVGRGSVLSFVPNVLGSLGRCGARYRWDGLF